MPLFFAAGQAKAQQGVLVEAARQDGAAGEVFVQCRQMRNIIRQAQRAEPVSYTHLDVYKRQIVADDDLAVYCPDLAEWARTWCYEDRDEPPGQQIVECFKPFLRHLNNSGLTRKTRHKHRDNLWRLGGELIRKLWETPRLRKRPIADWVASTIDAVSYTHLDVYKRQAQYRRR